MKTDVPEFIGAAPILLNRGSLSVAEGQAGHNDETIAIWIRGLRDYAEVITDLVAHELRVSEVEF